MQTRLIQTGIVILAALALTAVCLGQGVDTLKIKAEADSLIYVADSLRNLTQLDEAFVIYQTALQKCQQGGYALGEIHAMRGVGNVYMFSNDYTKALEIFQKCLDVSKTIGDRSGECKALGSIGFIYDDLCEYSKALEYYQASRAIAAELYDRKSEATSLLNIGVTYNTLNQYEKAIPFLQESLNIFRALNNRDGEAKALNNIGMSYDYLDEYSAALDCYKQAMTIFKETENRLYEAYCLGNIGAIFSIFCNYPKAIQYLQKNLEISIEFEDLKGQAIALYNIGGLYKLLNDHSKALEYYERGLMLERELGNEMGAANSLSAIGSIYDERSDYSRALDYNMQSMKILEQFKDSTLMARTLGNMGGVYGDVGDYQNALECFLKSLKLSREKGDKRSESLALANIGDIYIIEEKYDEAREYIGNGLKIARELNIAQDIQAYCYRYGNSYAAQGLDSQAVEYYAQSIEIVERIRGELELESQKTGYASGISETYEAMILAMLRTHRIKDAYNYAEHGKARSFLDLLASAPIKVGKPKHQEFLAQDSVYQKQKQQTEEEMAQAGADTAKILALRGKLDQQSRDAQVSIDQARRQQPELASLVSVDALTLPEVQKLLDQKTTLLEYFLTEKKTLVWAVTKNLAEVFQVDIGGDSLKTLVMAWRNQIETGVESTELSRGLYDLLVVPVAGHIKTDNLIIVPHGILHYLPFAALQNSRGRYLIDEFKISYLPSASVLKYLPYKRQDRGEKLLALGNPATDRKGFDPIPMAEAEVRRIASDYPQGQVFTQTAATEGSFKRLSPNYDILHLACHGDLNAAYPLYSCLLLAPDSSQDGELAVHEIFNLDLNANLVVLSACQTGLGHLTNGDEVVGLSRTFIYAGTPAIVSSLWMVEDESTAYLMGRFYDHLKKQSKAGALRQAQLDTRRKYPSTKSWASFVLIGEGR